jgi:hypothetical protein
MRIHLLIGLLLLTSCVHPPREGSKEWVVQQYSDAVLQSSGEVVQKYSKDGRGAPSAPSDVQDRLAGLHVIKLCPLDEDDTHYTALVLLGGQLDKSVYGLQVSAVKTDIGWRVEQAVFPVSPQGAAMRYLRNCNDDPAGERKPPGSTGQGVQ